MKILTVVSNLGVGGTQRVAQNYAIGLKKLGHDVALLAHAGRGPREEAIASAGIPIFAPSENTSTNDAVTSAALWHADIVHIHRSGYANARENEILIELRSTGAKVVETNVFARFDWSEGRFLIDAHLLLTEWCAYKWRSWGGSAAASKTSYILPNAVDVEAITSNLALTDRAALRSRLGIPDEQFVFGRIGQPLAPKWDKTIFSAFSSAIETGKDIGLLLVGLPPELERDVEILPAHVRSRIKRLPVTTSDVELANYFAAIDGFLHASHIGESFGMVLCEAMASGIPVITLSTPLKDNSQLEVVGHNQGGLIALSSSSLLPAMLDLMTNSQLRRHVQQNGAAWVETRFGLELTAKKATAIFESILKQNAGQIYPGYTMPNRKWVASMLSNGIGDPPSLITKVLFNTLHSSAIYRAYQSFKKLARRV